MRTFLAVVVLASLCASAAANPVIGVYTGGDPGEGLDFQGNFAYAIDFGGATTGGQTIGDAKFTPWSANGNSPGTGTPGATIGAQNEDSSIFQMGTTPADAALKSVVDTGRWADTNPANITADLTVQTGRQYLLQLIFQEGWNATAPGIRQFNIDVEGLRLATNFDITEVTGPQPLNRSVTPNVLTPNTRGAVLSYAFTATDNQLNVVLSQSPIDNPRIEALTLEIIPEPATLVMLGLLAASGLAIGPRRRRR
jgi:hypothetical protein